jgi:hypothetical protein
MGLSRQSSAQVLHVKARIIQTQRCRYTPDCLSIRRGWFGGTSWKVGFSGMNCGGTAYRRSATLPFVAREILFVLRRTTAVASVA